MKATITDGKCGVSLADLPNPKLSDYTCLCKTLAWATCSGTDQKIVSGTLPWPETYPGILGHESVGRVVEVGSKVRYIKIGDIFLRPTCAYPGEMLGGYRSLWGGFAEYGLVTDTKALQEDRPDATPNGYCIYQQQIPSDVLISAAEATMLITLKECASFVANVHVGFCQSVAILGSGPVAASMVFFAKLYGAHPVIAVGRRDEPLAALKKLGADFVVNSQRQDWVKTVRELTGGNGVDFVLDCAGDTALLGAAAGLLAPKGKLAPYALGADSPDRSKGPGEWSILFANPSENLAHEYIINLARLHLIPLREFYSHKLAFTQVTEAFDLLKNKKASKVVLELEK